MNISINDDCVIIDGKKYFPEEKNTILTLVDCFNAYHGTTEYNGIIAKIQEWYYGKMQKSPWCATAVSYFANICGLLNAIGGKADNVYNMLVNCKAAAGRGYGAFYDRDNIPDIEANDILFFLWEGKKMDVNSKKHVGVAEYASKKNCANVFCLGGNQKDKICTLSYNKSNLYAVYRIGG